MATLPIAPATTGQVPIFGKNWSRSKYDPEYVAKEIRQSTHPLEYSLDPNYAERCNPCFASEIGWVGKQGISYDNSKPMVDTESDLFNLSRVLTKDPSYKYQPQCIDDNCVGIINGCDQCQPKLYHFPTCDIKNESTRLSNPISNLREVGINRFQPICLNPQDQARWEHPGEIGINYRMVVKDNYVPCIPHPIDQTNALPKGGDLPCDLTHPTCSAPIAALHNYQRTLEQTPMNRYK
jgi:hypothetical protein